MSGKAPSREAGWWQRVLNWLWPSAEPPCEHYWRPCVAKLVAWNEYKPARQCLWCKEWQPMTPEGFYAQFGENFYTMAQRQLQERGEGT